MPTPRELANAIRFLSMDAVQKANSGHPGMPMGMADIAQVLWQNYLSHDPLHPEWPNRDRFIISNGHGSMLLYALLHLTGYALSIDDIKQFRQLHSKTPGHPEYGYTPGVETTTGPLGQGLANGVGMALAEARMAAEFNQTDLTLIDHYTYVFLGDGCLMEGISHEVASLAGTLALGKLIAFWDDNGISIDGDVVKWFTDDTPERFRAYGWHVIADVDGHSAEALSLAIQQAREVTDKPSLICCRTTIGFGAPHAAGSHKCHGSPLGAAEIEATRTALNWPYPAFVIPEPIYKAWSATEAGATRYNDWQTLWTRYQQRYPEKAADLTRRWNKKLPAQWTATSAEYISQTQQKAENVASRKASQNTLNAFAPILPELFGGSADLTESNLTNWQQSHWFCSKNRLGNYFSFGVREFGMSAMANGMALYGGLIPYVGTFLTFTDYARNAVRMAALMKQQVIFVYTHDSIGLGEDGPTHQPVEHAAMLRLTPNMYVWRPCDAVETAVAWQQAIEMHHAPSSLLLSRQALPCQTRTAEQVAQIKRGAYILSGDSAQTPELILIATGSELQLTMQAAIALREQNKSVWVVSMPCTTLFDSQDEAYRESVLPKAVRNRIAIEAAAADYWYKYVGLDGKVIGLNRYGESAPAPALFSELGFSVENIVQTASLFFE
ncbi:MAG: transketolase [Legionellales bacterium]|nr:transketolase [Legionellales bacterium]